MAHIDLDGEVLDIQNATHELSCSEPLCERFNQSDGNDLAT
jgi:hypothetical protein